MTISRIKTITKRNVLTPEDGSFLGSVEGAGLTCSSSISKPILILVFLIVKDREKMLGLS